MRTAVVTGANRGIGLEVCRQLAAKGLRVIVAARDAQKAADAARTITGEVHAIQLDVTNATSIASARREIERRFAAADVLVNNAAILADENRDLLDTDLASFRDTFETNV